MFEYKKIELSFALTPHPLKILSTPYYIQTFGQYLIKMIMHPVIEDT